MMQRAMICMLVAVSSGIPAVFIASSSVVQTHSISGEIEVEGRMSDEGVIVWVDSLHMTRTSASSEYVINGLDDGVYIVRAWSENCLAVVVDTVQISGSDRIGVNGSLFAGDIVQDGRINLHDAGVMLGHFLETPDSSQWSSTLDINGDQVIDSLDIAILINHWKESSDSPPPRWGIVVTEPDASSIWYLGQENVPVRWIAGMYEDSVSIRLHKNGVLTDTLLAATDNDGECVVPEVPPDLSVDSDYQVEVYCDEDHHAVSEYFSIEEGLIIINEPNGQTEWYIGQPDVSIEWDTGDIGGNLSIYLYLGSTPVDTVAMSTENDGIYEGYDVPEDLTPSGGYRIVLSREGGRDYFSEVFGIRQVIMVYNPDSNTVWPPGTEYGTIQWWDRVGLDGRVSLYLYKGDVEVDTIAYLIPNEYQSHFYHYPVPSDMPFGSDYRVLLVHEEGYFDYSDYFDIREPISVTTPKYGTVWFEDQDNALISWTTVGLGGNVSIELYRGSTRVETIVSETPNDGCYDEYTVPYGVTPGTDYRVLVFYDERFNDFSAPFEIEEDEGPPPTSGWVQQSPYPKSLRSVSFSDGNTGTAVGYRGTIVRTVDGGMHWIDQDSGTKNILWDVCFTSADTGTVVGTGSTILHTTDGGTTWTKQRPGICGDLYGVSFTDANNGTAVGAEGLIIRTIDGGNTWLEQTSGTAYELLDVSFVDAGAGWVVGESGIVLHTAGGETWTTQESGIDWTLHAVSFTDENTGTIVGSKYFDDASGDFWVLRTTDGGDTWNLHKRGYTYLYDVSFIDGNTGLAAGIPPHFGSAENTDILWTIDGGTTWEYQDSGTRHYISGVLMIDGNTAVAVDYWDKFEVRHGIILRTEDAGNT